MSPCAAVRPVLLGRRVIGRSVFAGRCSFLSTASHSGTTRTAVLYQALDPPLINGTRKPKKPGGYQDSGADIAYNLSVAGGNQQVITPTPPPNPSEQEGWSFPDTEEGILAALDHGATHLWANTILFASHPMQTSRRIGEVAGNRVRVIGQPPLAVEMFDDKDYVNGHLRRIGGLTMARAWTVSADSAIDVKGLEFPVVAKPARGRGSYGVKVCRNTEELISHLGKLRDESMSVMVEEFLQGEEATVTVMPPTSEKGGKYWSLPVVTRFNHQDGVAPYNGVVAVTSNSRVVGDQEAAKDSAYELVQRECEEVARLIKATAPIRIDVRRRRDETGCPFSLFDINMKPNMTGPGRPGRDDQASLTLMAAAGLGWDYPELLRQITRTATTLDKLRALKSDLENL